MRICLAQILENVFPVTPCAKIRAPAVKFQKTGTAKV